MKYFIYIGDRMIAEVSGCEAAWEGYCKSCKLAELLGEIAFLVDGEAGEVIANSHSH